jgi:hypothetical protein
MEMLTVILTDRRTVPILLIVAGIGALAWHSRHTRAIPPHVDPIGTTFLTSQGL